MAGGATNGVNGVTNGTHATTNGTNGINGTKSSTSSPPSKSTAPPAKRGDVESTFAKYAQLIHASRRPLPNQSGDGSYLREETKYTSTFSDVRTMGWKGISTLLAVRKHKKSGKLDNDREYIMERVINVCTAKISVANRLKKKRDLHSILIARCRPLTTVKDAQGPDECLCEAALGLSPAPSTNVCHLPLREIGIV